jgi:transcriptional regulator with XRE-family HTH domain
MQCGRVDEKVVGGMSRQAGVPYGPKESPAWRKRLGKQVAHYRLEHGEDQVDIGAVLNVDRSHISQIERGHQSLSCEKATLLCDHWGITLDALVGRETPAQDHGEVTRFTNEALNLPKAAFLFLWEILRLLHHFWPRSPSPL